MNVLKLLIQSINELLKNLNDSYGDIAQLGEQRTLTPQVVGSYPTIFSGYWCYASIRQFKRS